jgi:hypothetical protein
VPRSEDGVLPPPLSRHGRREGGTQSPWPGKYYVCLPPAIKRKAVPLLAWFQVRSGADCQLLPSLGIESPSVHCPHEPMVGRTLEHIRFSFSIGITRSNYSARLRFQERRR